MGRNRREVEEEDQDLNLAPIMNLVIILIPMLLLSVVFLQIGVINITAPKISMGPPSPEPPSDEKPLNLTVSVEMKGLRISAENAVLPEEPGCPTPGPTICLEKTVDVEAKIKLARSKMGKGDTKGGEKDLNEALAAYNWRALYNKLMEIKKRFPKETVIKLSAEPNMPYAALVRVMDVSRFKLQKDSYSKNSEFWAADYKKKGADPELLFSDPAMSVVR